MAAARPTGTQLVWLSLAPKACLTVITWDCGDGMARKVLAVEHGDLSWDSQHPHGRALPAIPALGGGAETERSLLGLTD